MFIYTWLLDIIRCESQHIHVYMMRTIYDQHIRSNKFSMTAWSGWLMDIRTQFASSLLMLFSGLQCSHPHLVPSLRVSLPFILVFIEQNLCSVRLRWDDWLGRLKKFHPFHLKKDSLVVLAVYLSSSACWMMKRCLVSFEAFGWIRKLPHSSFCCGLAVKSSINISGPVPQPTVYSPVTTETTHV